MASHHREGAARLVWRPLRRACWSAPPQHSHADLLPQLLLWSADNQEVLPATRATAPPLFQPRDLGRLTPL